MSIVVSGRRVLPKGWRWVKLGDAAELLASRSISTDGDVEVGVITTGCLREIGFDASGGKRGRMWADDARHSLVSAGEVLVARSNTIDLVGRAALVPPKYSGLAATDLTIRIRPREEINPGFLALYLSALYVVGYWRTQAGGASGSMKKITRKQVEALPIPVAPQSEQLKLLSAMTEGFVAVDHARAAAAARVRTISILTEAYATSTYGGPLTRHWQRRRLAQFADIVGGIQKTPDRAPDKNPVLYLTVRNVQRGWLDLTHVETFEVTADEVARLRLAQGDILIVEGNGSADQIGRNALFSARDEEWIHQNHVIRVRLRQELALPEFVSAFLNSAAGRVQMLEKARTTSGLYR